MAGVGFSGGAALEAKLKEIAARLDKAKTVQVGFMAGPPYPDGTSVPMVAAIQNYGAPEAGIPARPFFFNMVRDQSPTWGGRIAETLKATDYDANQTLILMGEEVAGELQDAIRDADFAPLASATVKGKGFDKQLIDTGNMFNSVHYAVDGRISDASKK